MKRALATVSLIALLPNLAHAAEWETKVTGYYNLGFGFADIDGANDGVGVIRDGEFHIRGKLTADNGLTFGARVEVEAQTAGDQIDENYGFIAGPFGTILIGGADTALNEHGGIGVVKPNGSYLNYYDNDGGFLPGDPGGFIGEDDGLGIRYFITFGGFEAGVSYQPDETVDGGADTNNPAFEANDQFAFGANYTGDFDGFEFAVGGGFLTNDGEDQYHMGVEAGFAGFTIAGFFNREDPDGASVDDVERYGIGAMYETGPWAVGGGYVHSNFKNGPDDEEFVHLGAAYQLAPGVTANAIFQYGEGQGGQNGTAVIALMEINF